MLLQALGVMAPQVVDITVTVLALLLVCYGVARLLRAFFRWLSVRHEVPRVAREIVRLAAQSAIAATLRHLPELETQEDAIREAAVEVYKQLPDVVYVPIRGRAIPVPIKLIVSQTTFVGVVLGLYRGVEHLEDELEQLLRDEYEYWAEAGKPGLLPERG